MRKPIIAGNWKMNKTPAEAVALVTELIPLVKDAKCDVVVCPPAVDLAPVAEAVKGTNIKVGAQNVHFKASGAFTGELSCDMLKAVGCEYVIIGHSERRQYFGETGKTATDEQANETIGVIRVAIAGRYGKSLADKVRIQYGGSMNPGNVKGLMAQPEIDGGLIGGASLKAPDFAKVVAMGE